MLHTVYIFVLRLRQFLKIGARTVAVTHLQSTVALWYLHSNSELQQSGDTGGTSASAQPSNRYGVEWANYYTPFEHLAVDFDLANSTAQFTEIDPDDAAPNSAGGKRVPEAVGVVISSGITLHNYNGFSSSLRLRYFGPRDLTSDGIFRSNQTVLLNGQLGYQIKKSRVIPGIIPGGIPIGPSVFTRVAHPVEPFQVRFGLARSF